MIAARSGTMRARDGVVDEGGDHDSAATVDLPTDVSKITPGPFGAFSHPTDKPFCFCMSCFSVARARERDS
jgi:hypothetical protein